MIILGIDPGTSKQNPTGMVVVDGYKPTLLDAVSVGLDSWQATAQAVYEAALRLRDYHYEAVAYEDVYLDKNVQATIKLARVGAMALAIGAALDIPVIEISAVEAKQALTGDLRADKAAMVKMARLTFGVELSSHLADACGVALAGEGKLRVGVMTNVR